MTDWVVGLAGWSGSGKTTLLAKLLARLKGDGIHASVIKRAHHDFTVDQPGKDSHTFRQAGAHEVCVASRRRRVLMREIDEEPSLEELLAWLAPCDVVFVEGFKREQHSKLAISADTQWPDVPGIKALIGTRAPPQTSLPFFHRDAVEDIAAWLYEHRRAFSW
ncbi:MAG: molybdopterin-guanine dinucleotide biosynthesis protein B [Pseudomonadota bacterium]